MPEVTKALLEAVDTLIDRVEGLDHKLNATRALNKRTRLLTVVTFAVATLSLIGMIVSGFLILEINKAQEETQSNAQISCQNGNDQRAANLALWRFVIMVSSSDDQGLTPEEQREEDLILGEIDKWIGLLFAPRDCDNLGERVEIPPPPDIPGLKEQ